LFAKALKKRQTEHSVESITQKIHGEQQLALMFPRDGDFTIWLEKGTDEHFVCVCHICLTTLALQGKFPTHCRNNFKNYQVEISDPSVPIALAGLGHILTMYDTARNWPSEIQELLTSKF